MKQSEPARRGSGLTPTDPTLLAAPIDFMHAVHLREREICTTLDRIADAGFASSLDIEGAITFLSDELPPHLEDEEKDLFPRLRKRCTEHDDIGRLLDRLQVDHRHADFDTPRVTKILGTAQGGLGPAACDELRRYADHARRHLILENAILLPFARLRLTDSDLETLRSAMMQRRGLDCPLEPKHAE